MKLKSFFYSFTGGKKRQANFITSFFPKNYNKYVEPFLGAGAVFLTLKPKKAVLSDIDIDIYNAWITFKDYGDLSNKIASKLAYFFVFEILSDKEKNEEYDFYLNKFNKQNWKQHAVSKLAWIMFHLKFSFGGGFYKKNNLLSRSFCISKTKDRSYSKKDKWLYTDENANSLKKFLNNPDFKFFNKDYKKILFLIEKNDVVFLDPPYKNAKITYGINKAENFNNLELLKFCNSIDKKEAYFFLTLYETKKVLLLFKNYKIIEMPFKKNIWKNKEHKKEILIHN